MKALIQTGSSLSACGHAQAGGRVPVPLKSDFLSIQRRRIQDAFFAGDKIDWNIIEFLREARKTRKVGLISNAWDGLRPWIRQQKFEDAFDHLTISAEVQIAKPLPGIYQYALNALAVTAEESIFVDDFIENIQAANALGMKAVHFKTAEQALADVKKLLNG